jgi:hypothetical protein
MSDPNQINLELINHATNDPEACGRDEIMTAEAINRKAGRLAWELIIADKQAKVNTRYISTGQHTLVLPDPMGTYVNSCGVVTPVRVGDICALDQLQDMGAVVAHDDEFAEIFDTTTGSRRVIFEVMPDSLGSGREWRQIVTGTGNIGGSVAAGFSNGNTVGSTKSRTFYPLNITGTPISYTNDSTEKTGLIDLASFTGEAIPANATHVLIRGIFAANINFSVAGSGASNLFVGSGNEDAATVKADLSNLMSSSGQMTGGIAQDASTMVVALNQTTTDNLRWVMPMELVSGTFGQIDRTVTFVIEGYYINEARPVGLGGEPLDLVGHTLFPVARNHNIVTVSNWNDHQENINLATQLSMSIPEGATHAIINTRIDSDDTTFSTAKAVFADRYTGAAVPDTAENYAALIDTISGAGGDYRGENAMTSYVPITKDNSHHISLRLKSLGGNETNQINATGYSYQILGFLVDEEEFSTNDLNPLVGRLIQGESAGGSNWTFPDLTATPRTSTVAYRNGQLMLPSSLGWFGLTLAIPNSDPTDTVQLMIFVEPNPLGEAEIITGGGNTVVREFVDYQGNFVTANKFDVAGLNDEPTDAYLVFEDGTKIKKANYTWEPGGIIVVSSPSIDSAADIEVSVLEVNIVPA